MVFAVENDAVHNICTRLLAIPKVSFSDINRVIARQLALSLVPACTTDSKSLIRSHIGEAFVHFVVHFTKNYLLLTAVCYTCGTETVTIFLVHFSCMLMVRRCIGNTIEHALVAVSKGMWAVKLCSNEILRFLITVPANALRPV